MGVKIEKLEHGMYRIPLQGLELEHITFDGTGKRPEFTLQLTDGRKPLYFDHRNTTLEIDGHIHVTVTPLDDARIEYTFKPQQGTTLTIQRLEAHIDEELLDEVERWTHKLLTGERPGQIAYAFWSMNLVIDSK